MFCKIGRQWHLGLIEHPRLGARTLVGGHVEKHQSPPEAAIQEALEESGRNVVLLPPPAPAQPCRVSTSRSAAAVVDPRVARPGRQPHPRTAYPHRPSVHRCRGVR
ncbi:NUDIX domain-containing protein [Nocardia altamirensis]|uniref:NUDIX domain-containing protein n=1 Tax=Nocardia altamirensis TaxID=472158 RepID=UPI00350E49A9